MFGKICGDKAAQKAILVTSMWDKVQGNGKEAAVSREVELTTRFWRELLNCGASTARFDNSPQSAMRILDAVIAKARSDNKLLLQEELVDHHLYLSETQAGQTLYSSLQTILASQTERLRQLAEQTRHGNPELSSELSKEYRRGRENLNQTFSDLKRMQIPFARRVGLYFRKKTKAVSIQSR